ncbi:hypothetical protein TYRP_018046 [Tyrophagus putrescentiae]|nr:hypothetical protein TYRP_018046 [Tyrophagus putrescentiae]
MTKSRLTLKRPSDGTEDSGGDSGGFIPTPPPYRPPIYTEAMRSSRFRNGGPRKGLPSSKFLDDPSSSSSKYPSMMPQIAKVLLESQSAVGHGATPRPRKNGSQKSGPNSRAQSQSYFEQYLNYGGGTPSTGATTPETGADRNSATESPGKSSADFLSRPYYESITPRPRGAPRRPTTPAGNNRKQQQYHHHSKFETTLESPQSASGSGSDNEESSPWQSRGREGDENRESSSTQPSSDNDFVPDDFDGFDFEKVVTEGGATAPLISDDQPPSHSKLSRNKNPFSSSSSSSSSFGNKFNPANSVVSGPNSYMTLSYAPLSEDQRSSLKSRSSRPSSSSLLSSSAPEIKPMTTYHSLPSHHQHPKSQKAGGHHHSRNHQHQLPDHPIRPRGQHHHQMVQNEPEYTPLEERALLFRTQTEHPTTSSSEDQQESPEAENEGDSPDSNSDDALFRLNYADTYARRGLHEAPEVPPSPSGHPLHRKNSHHHRQHRTPKSPPPPPEDQYSFQGSHRHSSTANLQQQQQPDPEWQRLQSQAEPEVNATDDESFHQESPPEVFTVTPPPIGSQAQAQAQALEKEKYDFAESVKQYAKEFGFEVPSPPGGGGGGDDKVMVGTATVVGNNGQKQTGKNQKKPAANSNHRRRKPSAFADQTAAASSKNESQVVDSHYYFNVLFPEFAADFKEKYQTPGRGDGLSQLTSSSASSSPTSNEASNPQSSVVPLNEATADDFRAVMSSFAAMVGEQEASEMVSKPSNSTTTTATTTSSTAETPATTLATPVIEQNQQLTKEDMDAILLQFNEVISSKEKAAAVEAAKGGVPGDLEEEVERM